MKTLASIIESEKKVVKGRIDALQSKGREGSLLLTGTEFIILKFIAEHIVVPIVTGLASRFLYDRLKTAPKESIPQVIEQLASEPVKVSNPVPAEEIMADLKHDLSNNSTVPWEKLKPIVQVTLDRVQDTIKMEKP
jgi:hypothetical protein